MKTFTSLLIMIVFSLSLSAQPWMSNTGTEKRTFKEIQHAFYEYWKDKPVEKGSGYKQFKRWEWFWESRLLENGEFPSSSINLDETKKYFESSPAARNSKVNSANWQFKGPSLTPGGYNGLGRVNCMAFHPTDANTFWVGTPAGGLWKTTNGGQGWTTNTDNLPVLGVSDIAIDPTNPSVMYIATGDGDLGSLYGNGDTKSIGILKSTNGGSTWNTTGLNWSVTDEKTIRRLIINPNNTQILLAASSDGIWRTSNGGTNWSRVQPGYFIDIEFNPADPGIAYASTFDPQFGNAEIYTSTNGGSSWSASASFFGITRINLAVSPADPTLVDAVCVNTSSGLAGLWYSANSGASFTQYFFGTNSNNLLHSSYNASGAGGQGHYDLAYALNPNDAADIWLGGVNTWNSTDGGSTFYSKTMWNSDPSINPNGVPTVHADKHYIAFHPLVSGTMFECNDGGIYKTTNGGASWTDLSNGLEISQMYKIGVSQTISNNIICGLQDNGSREIYNNQWYEQTGGDGMECIIDYVNASTEYASYAQGVIYRTYNFWTNQATISENIPGGQPNGAWVTPFVIHPTDPNILYAGYDRLYKTNDQGDSWVAISPVLTGDLLRTIAIAPSNPNTIYVATLDTLFLTTNGGATWNFVPAGIPNASISYMAVDPTDPQRIYVTLSGYSAGNKVYMSPDGGLYWYNYSGSLPNVPANCIVYENGSNEGLYVGTDIGVFYYNDSIGDWISYQNGLPNVVVTELEISYNDQKLWASTFGRGLWNSNLFNSNVGIEEHSLDSKIDVYPNPNNGEFTIHVPENMVYDLSVYDVLGELILEEHEIHSGNKTIQLDKANQGVYFVRLTVDGINVSRKIFISK
jgi:photosystem II stability/assembly factor-like uncharacterized protein